MRSSMKVTSILIAAAFMLTATLAWADSPELTACMDHVDLGAFKTEQWIACQTQELARQDHRLNVEYKKVQAQAEKKGSDAVKALVSAERQWLAYREAWCNFEAKSGGAPGPAFKQAACMVELTASQADKLHNVIY